MPCRSIWFALLLSFLTATNAYMAQQQRTTAFTPRASTVVEPPVRERVDRSNTEQEEEEEWTEEDIRRKGPLEYLEDDPEVSREMDDPFHILLLGSTFEKPKITIQYVSGSLNYVLDMPLEEAVELSTFSKDFGMSCLGTWPREQCLSLGKQLQVRDIVCRVVPYCEGGQRGWQAKDANSFNSNVGGYN